MTSFLCWRSWVALPTARLIRSCSQVATAISPRAPWVQFGTYRCLPGSPASRNAVSGGDTMACQVSAAGVNGSRSAYIEQNPKRAYVMQLEPEHRTSIVPNLP